MNFKKGIIKGSVIILFILISCPVLFATVARQQALNNNVSFEDDTDIFVFPSLLPRYANGVYVNLAPSPFNGDGGMIYGKENSIGIFFNRPSDHRIIDKDIPENYLFNLLLATRGKSSSSFGIGLSFAFNSFIYGDSEGNGTGNGDTDKAVSSMTGDFVISHTYRASGELKTSNSFRIIYSYLEDQLRPVLTFSLIDRTFFSMTKSIDLTFFPYFLYSVISRDIGDENKTLSTLDFNFEVGPKIKIVEDLVVGTLFGFNINYYNGNKDIGELKRTTLELPTANIGGEYTIKDRYTFRLGVQSAQVTRFVEDEDTQTNNVYSWFTGFGYRYKEFRIDGAINPDLFFNGPNIIGGGEPGFLFNVSTSYVF